MTDTRWSERSTRLLATRATKPTVAFGLCLALLFTGFVSCKKNSGEAIVLAKERIAPVVAKSETPDAESASTSTVQIREMADDEIAVDGYVMKPEVRGTGNDPRALSHEQWLVKVRMLDNGRTFQVPVDQEKWDKLRENDRVKVRYHTGKYTGAVWAAEIE
jgi:hypothetical protein